VSVTQAAGFLAGGVAAGLKLSAKPDLALVVNTGPEFTGAGVFTGNRVKAAPVLWSQQVVAGGRVRAVILNSGGANACTGPDGFGDTHRTAELVADGLGIGAAEVAVCSTGLIGLRLPMAKITDGIRTLLPRINDGGGQDAAEAILTTDSHAKQATFSDEGWSIGGMAKGAGMLAPGLATMLVVLTTDAVVDPERLPEQLAEACRVSFDRVDSDGCMSTIHQRHGAAAQQRRVRSSPDAGRLPGRAEGDLSRPGYAAARGCRRRGPRHRDHGAARGE
jgi:glutamate N-acetyltransferase/amino-acid N-acetyltransferase